MTSAPSRILVTGGSGFIGTALVSDLLAAGHVVASLDLKPPTLAEQLPCWIQGDVLDPVGVAQAFASFKPTHLVHLAAEVAMNESGTDLVADFPINCRSAAILAEAVTAWPVVMSVMVSTQYVCGPEGGLPQSEEQTFPHTRYGASKARFEEEVRRCIPGPWAILRPTYIWGPYNQKNVLDVLRAVARGRYLHPGGGEVVRSYGYVGSVAWCICRLLERPDLAGRTLYATDRPEDSRGFMDRLCRAFLGRSVRAVPRPFLRVIAKLGDHCRFIPLNTFRLYNMTTPYPVPWQWTADTIGLPPTDLTAAAAATAAWYQQAYGQPRKT